MTGRMYKQSVEQIATKRHVEEFFTKTVDNWAGAYNDPYSPSLHKQTLVPRMRLALVELVS